MSLRKIFAKDQQQLLKKLEKLIYFMDKSNQTEILVKNNNWQYQLNKTHIGDLFFLLDNVQEKILCTAHLPVSQCCSLNSIKKKIDIFIENWNKKLNLSKEYNFDPCKQKHLLEWSCSKKTDSSNLSVNFFLASNQPIIEIEDFSQQIIGFFQDFISLPRPFDFDPWKRIQKQQRCQKKKSKNKMMLLNEENHFENEIKIKTFLRETREKEEEEKEEIAIKTSCVCVKLQNFQLYQNSIFQSEEKKLEIKNKNNDENLLNFPKKKLNFEKNKIDLVGFSQEIFKKHSLERKIFLSHLPLNWQIHNEKDFFVQIPSKNTDPKWNSIEDNYVEYYNKSQCQTVDEFKTTNFHNEEENLILDTSSKLTKIETIQVKENRKIDKKKPMSYLNNKKQYQLYNSYFSENFIFNVKSINKAIHFGVGSKRSFKLFTSLLPNIHHEHALSKSIITGFNAETVTLHIDKLMSIFLCNFKESTLHVHPTNKHIIISCDSHPYRFSGEYKIKKSIDFGNKSQISNKNLICIDSVSQTSNIQEKKNTRELVMNNNRVSHKSTESLHVSILPNENRFISNVLGHSKPNSLKQKLITACSNNLKEEDFTCIDVESKSQSLISDDNNSSVFNCVKIASNQTNNSVESVDETESSNLEEEKNTNCPKYRNTDYYNCWANTNQDSCVILAKRKQPLFCKDNNISGEFNSNKDCIPCNSSNIVKQENIDKPDESKDKLQVEENENYNEYRVIKKPRLQLREDKYFDKEPQTGICFNENQQDLSSHDQIVPANGDQILLSEESSSFYNSSFIGNEKPGVFCWNTSLNSSNTDMKEYSRECPLVLPVLTTCNKPLRIGLSKRQKLPPLHPQAKKRRCMLTDENQTI